MDLIEVRIFLLLADLFTSCAFRSVCVGLFSIFWRVSFVRWTFLLRRCCRWLLLVLDWNRWVFPWLLLVLLCELRWRWVCCWVLVVVSVLRFLVWVGRWLFFKRSEWVQCWVFWRWVWRRARTLWTRTMWFFVWDIWFNPSSCRSCWLCFWETGYVFLVRRCVRLCFWLRFAVR